MREQVSPEVVAYAAAYHLGLPRDVYPASVARSNGLYTIIATILVGGLLVNGLRTGQWIWLFFAGLVLLLLFGPLASTLVVRHTSMVICTQGLLRIAGKPVDSIRWEEMREVWQNEQGFLTVAHPDGATFVINTTFRPGNSLWPLLYKSYCVSVSPKCGSSTSVEACCALAPSRWTSTASGMNMPGCFGRTLVG